MRARGRRFFSGERNNQPPVARGGGGLFVCPRAHRRDRVDGGPGVEEEAHARQVALPSGEVEGREAGPVPGVQGGAGVQEQPQEPRAARAGGLVERRARLLREGKRRGLLSERRDLCQWAADERQAGRRGPHVSDALVDAGASL